MNRKQKAKRKVQKQRSPTPKWLLLLPAGVVACVIWWGSSRSSSSAHTDHKSATEVFAPTLPNSKVPREPAPEDMVWIPGGEFSMGAMDPPASTQASMHAAAD